MRHPKSLKERTDAACGLQIFKNVHYKMVGIKISAIDTRRV